MPEQRYEKYLDDDNYVYVYFQTEKRKVQSFVVKLLCRFRGIWYEVVRYDGGHGIPHKDVLQPDWTIARKVWYRYMNNNQALDFALDEVNEQYEFYRWRFEQWLNRPHQQ